MKPILCTLPLLFVAACSDGGAGEKSSSTATAGGEAALAGAIAAELPHTIDKGDGLMVEVLEVGHGPIVKMGDRVALDYSVAFVPEPEPPKATEPSKAAADDKSAKDAQDEKAPSPKGVKDEAPQPADAAQPGASTTDAAPKLATDATVPTAAEPVAKDASSEPSITNPAEASAAANLPAAAIAGDSKAAAGDLQKPAGDLSKPADVSESAPATEAPATDAAATTTIPPAVESAAAMEAPPVSDAPAPVPLAPRVVSSTFDRATPAVLELAPGSPGMIPGLQRALEGLPVGTRARVIVPAALAYGKAGLPAAGIPGDTPLQIEIAIRGLR